MPPAWLDGGSWSFPFGTDSTGRDLFTRMLFGVRLSLLIGLAAVAFGGLIGVTAGILAGYYDEKIAASASAGWPTSSRPSRSWCWPWRWWPPSARRSGT